MIFTLHIEDSLPSTQTALHQAARAGAPAGTAILARRQTAGQGRAGRPWSSPPGNLAISILLRPEAPIREAPQWALRAAVALAETLAPHAPALRLKWPNDLLLGEAKLAGILAEAEADAAGRIAHLILGIGANLAFAPALPDRPTAALPPPAPAPEAIAPALFAQLTTAAAAPFADIRAQWLARGPTPGTPLTLRDGTTGAFAGLAEDGALLLTSAADTLLRFPAAEII